MTGAAFRLAATLLLANGKADAFGIARRHFLAAVPTSAIIFCGNAAVAGTTDADLLKDLQAAKITLAALPNMVGDQQWDPVRNELREYFRSKPTPLAAAC